MPLGLSGFKWELCRTCFNSILCAGLFGCAGLLLLIIGIARVIPGGQPGTCTLRPAAENVTFRCVQSGSEYSPQFKEAVITLKDGEDKQCHDLSVNPLPTRQKCNLAGESIRANPLPMTCAIQDDGMCEQREDEGSPGLSSGLWIAGGMIAGGCCSMVISSCFCVWLLADTLRNRHQGATLKATSLPGDQELDISAQSEVFERQESDKSDTALVAPTMIPNSRKAAL
mmetsp:Transcript_100407/g.183539  ORF Transcript_100407/g.183539 Transcript_100407/m.183539 type:complete len:227 (-) Transcript_100407:73-753(-)